MLKQTDFPVSKLVEVAEIKSWNTDVRSRTSKNILKLNLMLKRIDYIYNLGLYATENIYVLISWVPIPCQTKILRPTV